jgi:hypothetical protein
MFAHSDARTLSPRQLLPLFAVEADPRHVAGISRNVQLENEPDNPTAVTSLVAASTSGDTRCWKTSQLGTT